MSLAKKLLGVQPAAEPSGPFDPSSIAGMQLWLDAQETASITTDGASTVTAWEDQSPNGATITVTPNNAQSPPTPRFQGSALLSNTINGVDGVEVLDYDQFLATGVLFGDPVTVFIVFKRNSVAGQLFDIRDADNSGPLHDDGGNGGFNSRRRNTANQLLQTNAATQDSDPHVYRYRCTGSGGVFNFWLDGVVSGGADKEATGVVPTSLDQFFIAKSTRSVIGEVIAYNTSLTNDECDAVEEYLADKWGITL